MIDKYYLIKTKYPDGCELQITVPTRLWDAAQKEKLDYQTLENWVYHVDRQYAKHFWYVVDYIAKRAGMISWKWGGMERLRKDGEPIVEYRESILTIEEENKHDGIGHTSVTL